MLSEGQILLFRRNASQKGNFHLRGTLFMEQTLFRLSRFYCKIYYNNIAECGPWCWGSRDPSFTVDKQCISKFVSWLRKQMASERWRVTHISQQKWHCSELENGLHSDKWRRTADAEIWYNLKGWCLVTVLKFQQFLSASNLLQAMLWFWQLTEILSCRTAQQ